MEDETCRVLVLRIRVVGNYKQLKLLPVQLKKLLLEKGLTDINIARSRKTRKVCSRCGRVFIAPEPDYDDYCGPCLEATADKDVYRFLPIDPKDNPSKYE